MIRTICCIAALLLVGAGAAAASKEDLAARAVESVDPDCGGANLQASGSGWVAQCSHGEATRFYFVRVAGRKGQVTLLLEHKDPSFHVEPNSLNVDFSEGTRRWSKSFFLEGEKPELPDESFDEGPGCPPERYRDHYNRFAATLRGPKTTLDHSRHQVVVERQVLECRNGINTFAYRAGELIPNDGKSHVVQHTLVPVNGGNPAKVTFTVAAQANPGKKSTRFLLRANDPSASPGDHFEVWLAPPGLSLSCDEAFKVSPSCATVGNAVKLSIARGSDGKLVTSTEPAGSAKDVSVSLAGDSIAAEVPDLQVGYGLAILYLDANAHVTVGTGRPEKGEFSTVGAPIELTPPKLQEKIVPLK